MAGRSKSQSIAIAIAKLSFEVTFGSCVYKDVYLLSQGAQTLGVKFAQPRNIQVKSRNLGTSGIKSPNLETL